MEIDFLSVLIFCISRISHNASVPSSLALDYHWKCEVVARSFFNKAALWLYVYLGWKENERSSGSPPFRSPLQFFISPAAFIPYQIIRIIYAPPYTHFKIWFPAPSGRLEKQPSERPWPLRSLRHWQRWFIDPLFSGQEREKRWVQIMDYLGDTCDISLVSEEAPSCR